MKSQYFLSIFLSLTIALQVSAKETLISSTLEQSQIQITKTFSLRLKEIRKIRLTSKSKIKLMNFYYESLSGHKRGVEINSIVDEKNSFELMMEKSSIKKITFTAMSVTNEGKPIVEVAFLP